MHEFLVVILCFVLSWATAGVIRRIGASGLLIDRPNHRSSHSIPTPRGGGVAIVLGVLVASSILYVYYSLSLSLLVSVLVAGLVVGGTGLADDLYNLRARTRFVIQVGSAAIVVFLLVGIPVIDFGLFTLEPSLLTGLVTVVSLVWLTNLFNFMDGIDGIAGAEAIFVLGGATILQAGLPGSGQPLLLVSAAAAVMGFLLWNWPPAKLFMGDVGSGFLGFFLGTMAIASAKTGDLGVVPWLILLSVFIVDTTVTLIRRLFRGERWFEAHRSHAYQHASRRFGTHKRVVLGVLVINVAWLLPLAWLSVRYPAYGWLALTVAWGSNLVPVLGLKSDEKEVMV